MLGAESEICLALDRNEDITLVTHACQERGITKITAFPDAGTAFQAALVKQFHLFFLRFENPTLGGLAFLQKLRASGNYGLETHFFLADKIDEKAMNILTEYDVHYVLLRPFTLERVSQKLDFVLREEANVSEHEAKYRMAKSALSTGMDDIAETCARELVTLPALAEKALVLLGDVEVKRKRYPEARAHFEAALKANPKSAAAAHKVAETYMAEKDFHKAAELMNTLTTLNPYNLALLVNAGLSNLEDGNADKAKELLAEVRKMDSRNAQANNVMAKVHLREGNYEAMCSTLQETHSEKEVVASLNHLGVEMSHKGDFAGAMKMYRNCLEHIKGNEFVHIVYYNMGLCCIRLHDYATAKDYLHEALKRHPDFEKAKQALEAIPR